MFIGEPAFWGQGYARDAVMALLSYAFDRLDLHLVQLWTLAANVFTSVRYQIGWLALKLRSGTLFGSFQASQ